MIKRCFYNIVVAILTISSGALAQSNKAIEVWSTNLEKGVASPLYKVTQEKKEPRSGWREHIYIQTGTELQTIEGVGGAFNEIGGQALLSLPKKEQNEVMQNLFGKDKAGFTFCRTAIGASDFGLDAYSYSNTPNDFEMKHFSIERDKKYVLPYLKSAFAINKEVTLFGSPWSPPAWLKVSESMEGQQKDKPNTLKEGKKFKEAYAKYFVKYVQAYEAEGVRVDRICIQNENDANTKYTSCTLRAKEMIAFAKDYMIPAFEKNKVATKIYAGTFRASDQMDLLDFVQSKDFDKLEGAGVQYTPSVVINDALRFAPGLKFFHTEGRCFNGKNTAGQASTRLGEVAGYINSGATAYSYWNMILNETTKSAWDWSQNSLINIDRMTRKVTYNPDYNVMYLISKFMKPGDVRVASVNRGVGAFPMITVKSPDGTIKILIQNTLTEEARTFKVLVGEEMYHIQIPGQKPVAIVIKK